MSGGYPHPPPGYGYGQPPSQNQPHGAVPYGSAPPPQGSAPYGAPAQPYGAPAQPYGAPASYGSPSPYGGAPSAPYGAAPGEKPKKDKLQAQDHSYGAAPGGYPQSAPGGYQQSAPGGYQQSAPGGYPPSGQYGSPFAALVPTQFPPGTDPNIVACFQAADRDGSGFIDDKELQGALSSYNQAFSMRTVHLLMYLFTNTNNRKIGPKEFASLFFSLQSWRGIFERFDKDRSGKIDSNELREALLSLGFAVSPVVLELLVSKFDKTGGKNRAIEYDNFIECCLTVKGLTEKFKEKDLAYSGSATFTYEAFMLTVLPFLIA